jgi:hypothetical protein
LENVESDIGKLVSSKMKGVLEKDTISWVLMGEEFSITEISEEFTSNNLVNLKYAPIACVDVERSFSKYNNRRSFTCENLLMFTAM